MQENKVIIAKVTNGKEIIPILVYRKGIYIREFFTNRILYDIKTKESIIDLLFGDGYVIKAYKNPKNKEEYQDGYMYANLETINSYKEIFKSEKPAKLKKALSTIPTSGNEIFKVQLLVGKTTETVPVLVYFEDKTARELITGHAISYVKKEKITENNTKETTEITIPGDYSTLFFEVSEEHPLFSVTDSEIKAYKKPDSLGNKELDLKYLDSLAGNQKKL